ncbi:MAG: PIN domain-containing protein [Thermoplasmata archaeon]|nr:PIN domain-containing protein [Thermoplasmata archaeon]
MKVRAALGGERLALTPDLVLAEVSRKLGRDGVGESALQTHLGLVMTLSSVVGIDLPTALAIPQADRDLKNSAREHGLGPSGLGDAVVLATARTHHGKVLTADPHFKNIAETEWLT